MLLHLPRECVESGFPDDPGLKTVGMQAELPCIYLLEFSNAVAATE